MPFYVFHVLDEARSKAGYVFLNEIKLRNPPVDGVID
jgi:hypothetical protein